MTPAPSPAASPTASPTASPAGSPVAAAGTKVVVALTTGGPAADDAATARVHDLLLDRATHAALADEGAVTALQVNLADEAVAGALVIEAFPQPVAAVVSLRTTGPLELALTALAELTGAVPGVTLHAWAVTERVPLAPPAYDDGVRHACLANLAFIRRPPAMTPQAWLAHWHGPHTEVAMATQATHGYVQDLVTAVLTPDAPPVDGIVEELFAMAGIDDVHAFYGSDGDDDELARRLARLMDSVTVMGADQGIHLVPTSRYTFRLAPA